MLDATSLGAEFSQLVAANALSAVGASMGVGSILGGLLVGTTNYAANEVNLEIAQLRVKKLEADLKTAEGHLAAAIAEAAQNKAKARMEAKTLNDQVEALKERIDEVMDDYELNQDTPAAKAQQEATMKRINDLETDLHKLRDRVRPNKAVRLVRRVFRRPVVSA